MSRASFIAVTAALAVAAAACGKSSTPAVTGQLRQPSSIATFVGYTIADGLNLLPYVAIANTDRNDLTILNAKDDSVVKAPVQLRPLAIPVTRPAMLASTSLGEETTPGGARKPDLLVVVSAGDSKLQLVQTWTPDNTIVDQGDGVTYSVDLPGDVLDIAVIPSPPGTARLAVAISGRRLAVVHYKRIASGAKELIVPDTAGGSAFVVQSLAFEPAALATVPGDAAHVYAASLEPVGPGPVFGVAELDVSAPAGPWPARALGARGATRLVAAAALHAERRNDAIASDTTAFDGQAPVTRIYAVLDEASCGHDRPIDCGVVALDPALDTATRGNSIPDDWTSVTGERWMPYRAPIQFAQRALAIAASQPPALPPSTADADQIYHGDFMRLAGTVNFATTAVAAVAAADAQVHFLDLGRFKEAAALPVPPATLPSPTVPTTVHRLWFQKIDAAPGPQFADATREAAAAEIRVTPGWTPNESWTIGYQAALPNLLQRRAEAGSCASPAGCPGADPAATTWLAIQVGGPGPVGADRKVTQVARLFHPALGARVGDIVVIRADGVGLPCEGTTPPGTLPANESTTPTQFEVQITGLLAPDAGRPGGFVTIGERTPLDGEPLPVTDPNAKPDQWAKWRTCLTALTDKIAAAPDGIVTSLIASVHARELVLNGSTVGYAGRPAFGAPYTLQYRDTDPVTHLLAGPDEDALAASCPLADWDGTLPPPTCGGGACDRATCERLVLARKARRVAHISEDCGTDAACLARAAVLGLTFPVANGPALQFQVDTCDASHPVTLAQPCAAPTGTILPRDRTLSLAVATTTGTASITLGAGAVAFPNGAISFDRSPWDQAGSYRFYVTYPAGLVVDASPVVSPVSSAAIR